MKQVGSHKPSKATNVDCFAYDGGRCNATKAAVCSGCPFYKSRKDRRNNVLMETYNKTCQAKYEPMGRT